MVRATETDTSLAGRRSIADAPGSAETPAGGIPEISVVIVTWNSGTTLLDCLHSLREHPPACPWEAIVVDNASTDGSIERVLRELPWVRVIANPTNRGLAAANNQGLAASSAPFACIANPDVLFRTGSLDALHDLLARRSRAAFAVARLEHPDGRLQPSAGDLPTLGDALLGRSFSLRRRRGGGRAVWWHDWAHDEERPVGHGAEACYLVRRAAVADIGLQDERFVLDWEGLEWSRRAREAGWEVWFCPAAPITHLGGTSLGQVPLRWIASTHRGMYLYLRSRVPALARPLLAAAIAARASVKALAVWAGARVYERAHGAGAQP